MIIWILEHTGGKCEDYYSEILGVFDSLENAKATYPNAVWKSIDEEHTMWEWEFDAYHLSSLYIFPMELNKLYLPAYYLGEIK